MHLKNLKHGLSINDVTQFFPFLYSGTVSTYNYNNGNGYHLANQNQKICIR